MKKLKNGYKNKILNESIDTKYKIVMEDLKEYMEDGLVYYPRVVEYLLEVLDFNEVRINSVMKTLEKEIK